MGLDFHTAYDYESLLHSIFEPYKPEKYFGGYTECFVNVNIDTYKSILTNIIQLDTEIVENIDISWR